MANWCIPRVYATLDLGHRKFAVDMARAEGEGHINRKLPLTSVSGRIYAEYTAQPWFILYIYIYIYIYIHMLHNNYDSNEMSTGVSVEELLLLLH